MTYHSKGVEVMKVPMMSVTGITKEAVQACRESILGILKAGRSDDVTKVALDQFGRALSGNIAVTGCTLVAEQTIASKE